LGRYVEHTDMVIDNIFGSIVFAITFILFGMMAIVVFFSRKINNEEEENKEVKMSDHPIHAQLD